jgi:nucleoid-associated protein EbfC
VGEAIFDSTEEPVDYAAVLERAQMMRRRLESRRVEWAREELTGLGGNGLVRAVVTGEGRLVALDVDASIVDPDDPVSMSELIREAVNDAIEQLTEQRARQTSELTAGLRNMLGPMGRAPVEPRVVPMTANRPPHIRGGGGFGAPPPGSA